MAKEQRGIGAYLVNLGLLSVLTVPKLLPYRWRIPLVGWLTSHVVAPLAGYDRRIRENLALVCPDMDQGEVHRLTRAVPDNAGRMLAEMYSSPAFLKRVRNTPMKGPGVEALEKARLEGHPIIAVSGHFGNYDVLRATFDHAGHRVGGLYRPMSNAYFNKHYTHHLKNIAQPAFEQGRRGLGDMIRHLRGGNMIALLTDQRDAQGAPLKFFGHRVMTPLSAADLALKYDAVLIPCYAVRKENGLDFDILIEAPIPHSDSETMMQAVNDSLEAQVRLHMDQWLWVHRRWKDVQAP